LGKNTLKGELNDIKVDFITHAYPFVDDIQHIEQIRMAGLRDIAAMKLNAIAGNGTQTKDFIDIASLSSFFDYKSMLDAYEKKYADSFTKLILENFT